MNIFNKNIVIIGCLLFIFQITQPTFSQNDSTFSIKKQIDSLNALAYGFTYSDLDSAFVLARKANKLSININYDYGNASTYFTLGTSYFLIARNDSALFLLQKSADLFKLLNDKLYLAKVYIMLGIIKSDEAKYSDVAYYNNKALELFTEVEDYTGISLTLLNMAELYSTLGDSEKEMEYLLEGAEIAKHNKNTSSYSYSLISIGINYIKKDFGKAYNYLDEAKKICKKLYLKEDVGQIHTYFADLYIAYKKYDLALKSIDNALAIYKTIGNVSYQISAEIKKIKILEKLRMYDKAILLANKLVEKHSKEDACKFSTELKYLKGKLSYDLKKYSTAINTLEEILLLPKSNNDLPIFRDTYKILYEIAELKGNHKEAFANYKNFTTLRDSINILETKAKGLNYEKLRDLKVKEKEIADLKKDKIIANLEISYQKSFRNFLFISFALLGSIILIVSLNYIKIRSFNGKLKLLNESEQRFLRIISHDIRNSLGAVINFSNMLIIDKYVLTEKESDDSIVAINKAALSTNNLLTNLLQWTLAKKNDLSFTPKNENLKTIVEEGIASSQSLIAIKELELSIDINDNIFVFIDSYSITSVIRNLLTNAIKFSNLGGKISFTTNIIENFIELSLADTGVGMDAVTLNNLFNDAVHHTTKGTNEEKGIGIGISLIKKFVKMNGGAIEVKSKLGKGSTFSFTMPLSKNESNSKNHLVDLPNKNKKPVSTEKIRKIAI